MLWFNGPLVKTQFEAHRICLLSTQKSPVCGHSSFLPHLFPSAFVSLSRFFPSLALPGRAFSLRALPVEALLPLLGRSFGWVGSASMLPLSDSRSSFGKASSCPFGFPPGFVHPVGFPPVSGVMSRSSLSEFCTVPPRLRSAQAFSWFHRICSGCCWSPRGLPCSNTYSS